MLEFEISGTIPAYPITRCAFLGIGGAGGNISNALITSYSEGITYISLNTDIQSLEMSRAHEKIRLGAHITKGRGAGANPEIGKLAAEEDIARILESAGNFDLVFLVGGLGGGTASGAMPVIAQALKERDILTVCIVTKPFSFEGKRRLQIADQAELLLQSIVDTLIVIPNEKLLHVDKESNFSLVDSLGIINGIIGDCVRSIVDIIMKPGHINVDFADIKTVIKGMGSALMGTARARGSDRALQAAHAALSSPFLDTMSIRGARSVLINISGNNSLGIHEIQQATARITEDIDEQATIIIGSVIDETMGEDLGVTVIATNLPAAQRYQEKAYTPFASAKSSSESKHIASEKMPDAQLTKEHPLRDMLPSLEKKLKDHYSLNQDDLEIPTLLRKVMKEQPSNKT